VTGILVPAPTEADWLAARRDGITASEIAIVMGLAPDEWASPFSLYHQKLGDLPPAEDTTSMRIGRHLERLVCDLFAERYPGLDVRGDGRQLYAHPERPWQMATPDRLLYEAGWDACRCGAGGDVVCTCITGEPVGVLEAKTSATYDGWGDDGSDEIPVHYRCQALWQMDTLGVTAASVSCLFLHSRKVRVYDITLDDAAEADLKLLREEAALFWSRIQRQDEPEVDWRPATTDALKHLNQGVEQRDITIGARLARSYRAAVRRYKEAEQRKDLLTNRMLQGIGTGRRALDPAGRPVATRSVYPNRRIAVAQLRAEYPEAAAACTVTKDVTKLLPAKGDS
jgi:putative phage-type endonuclease